ncbi:hypothetical protein OvHV-2gp12 [Ovine gammaherpesvirus 2]|uniref:Uncharacterized protein n=1 Tax=Ovine gammaherpesvirus 2 TaxID=10398 RepID=A1BM03_9GAMA|nr:hypothetical protein OvHV-2gp12 [Ovine gammaherpesvirus 2]
MTTIVAPMDMWTIQICDGRFVLVNRKSISVPTHLSQVCIPYSVSFIADSLASFGLLSSLFTLEDIKKSCALLVQHERNELCTVLPTCVLDLNYELTLYVRSHASSLPPGSLQIALLFVCPMGPGDIAWDNPEPLESMAGQRLYSNVSQGTVAHLGAPGHMMLSGEAIGRRDGTYDLFFQDDHLPCMLMYAKVSATCTETSQEILPQAMEARMVGPRCTRLSFRPGIEDPVSQRVKFQAEIMPFKEPKVLFKQFLNWIQVNSDCQVIPLYPEEEEVVRPHDWARLHLNTTFAVSTALSVPVKIFICGLGQASFLVADPGVWSPSRNCLVTLHNISNKSITISPKRPVAVGLLLYCQRAASGSRNVSFSSQSGKLQWQNCEVEGQHIFSWPHHTSPKTEERSPQLMSN